MCLLEPARGAKNEVELWIKGYLGRIGIYELMIMDAKLRRLVSEQADVAQLEQAARAAGMKTLWEDGIAKVAEGLTTIDELERVLR